MSNPLVSICITTYNVEKYIEKTIESVISQKTDFTYEILIGDDFSTDNTRNILLKYKEIYPNIIRLIFHDKNIGVLKNDLSLVQAARGFYIAWCDGDDWWIDNHKISKQVNILSNNNIALVHTNWDNYHESIDKFERISIQQSALEESKDGVDIIELLMLNNYSGIRFSSCMFRRYQILESFHQHPRMYEEHLSNDLAIFIGLCQYGKFFHLKDTTTAYRIRPESLSITSNHEKRVAYLYGLFNLLLSASQEYGVSAFVKYRSLKTVLDNILYIKFKHQIFFDIDKVLSSFTNLGYKLTLGQKFLYLGSKNKYFRFFAMPFYSSRK